jgi:hypothetical protein
MPAKSKAQQRFMSMVLAKKRGEDVGSSKVAKAASSMTQKEARDFTSTPRKGLPEHAVLDSLKSRVKNRRFGNPKTEKERKATHFKKFGTKKLPPRGSGLK